MEGQVCEDGDPSEDEDYNEKHGSNKDEIDDSREDENTQNISVLLTGGDDQMENQTTANKIPVGFIFFFFTNFTSLYYFKLQ